MVDKSISMDINEVLELDYMVEEISDGSIGVVSGSTGDLNYVSRRKVVLDPSNTGTYELEIDSKVIEIEVVDIPSSVISRYDATEVSGSDGDTVSTFSDKIGVRDLYSTGDPILKTGVINGNQVVRTDGTDDYLSTTDSFVTSSVNFAVIVVGQIVSSTDTGSYVFDGGSDLEFALQDDRGNSGNWEAHRGGTTNINLGIGSDTSPHIYVLEGFSGGGVSLQIDGTDYSDQTSNNSNLTGLGLGARFHSTTDYLNFDYGEVEVLKDYTSSDITDEKSRLSDKWGITI